MSEQSTTTTDQPTCDHGDCQPDPNPAVTQHETVAKPGYPVQQFWACPKHQPDAPAIQHVDPGPENRSIDTGTDQSGGAE